MNIEDSCISCIDTDWSYQLARRMEKEKTNPVLGYRTAGSAAETATGDMLYREMKAIGLTDVTRDTFSLDGWEFEKAVLKFTDDDGQEHTFQMGGYQTNFETDGFEDYELVYLGKGTAADYEGIKVKGKLVMVEINQRNEWWISFPVYQAYLRGAAALIAVQANGYGEIAESALNAQDIAGPDFAPAFSLSQADARILKRSLRNKISACEDNTTDSEDTHNTLEQDAALLRRSSLKVSLDARSRVIPDTTAGNITGKIQGTETDSMILLSAHYDSYFDGFQDDNAAVAMMLGIARSLVKGGYKPAHTLVFCAMAAEEWGIIDSKYDWSTGAYNQVFRVHPDWQGKVIADLNFELPAHAHNRQDAIRCTYEYADFIRQFTDSLTVPKEAYPDGITVLSPIETWSDDFSMAIAGIPSTVNDFSAGPFMQNYYHSQYDNQDVYQEAVYQFHHECYLKLIMAIDRLQKLSQDLPWCKFLSFHQHRITFFTDSIDIIDHDSALFPDKVICFQSYAIVFLLRSPAQNTGSLILISTRFHRKRTCLVSFSVIIAYLRILFAKINSHDQITNFVHLFLPVSGQSVPALLSRSQTSSSHTVPGEDTSSPVKTLLSFYPVCVQRASD